MVFTSRLQSIWNMDEARLRVLNEFMICCELDFASWNINGIYINLKSIRRIVYAKLKDPEIKEVEEDFKELEEYKRKIKVSGTNPESLKFYDKADEIYIKLNRLMQQHGLFFREGEDPTRAALRR